MYIPWCFNHVSTTQTVVLLNTFFPWSLHSSLPWVSITLAAIPTASHYRRLKISCCSWISHLREKSYLAPCVCCACSLWSIQHPPPPRPPARPQQSVSCLFAGIFQLFFFFFFFFFFLNSDQGGKLSKHECLLCKNLTRPRTHHQRMMFALSPARNPKFRRRWWKYWPLP